MDETIESRAPDEVAAGTAILLTLGGTAAMGALLGLARDVFAVPRTALGLAGIVGGVAVLMIPALYIGLNVVGQAPLAADMGRALLRGARSCGLVLLGLLAPVAVLLATTHSVAAVRLLGAAAIAWGAWTGLRTLYERLFPASGSSLAGAAVFVGWSMVALGLGAHFTWRLLGA